VPDTRNSLSLKLAKELHQYGFKCQIHDPLIDHLKEGCKHIILDEFENMQDLSIMILLVDHDFYRDLGLKLLSKKCKQPSIIMDATNLFIKEGPSLKDSVYWHL